MAYEAPAKEKEEGEPFGPGPRDGLSGRKEETALFIQWSVEGWDDGWLLGFRTAKPGNHVNFSGKPQGV